MTIGIIIGSLREQRQSDYILQWLLSHLENYHDITPMVLDLKTYQLPFFGQDKNNEAVVAWRLAIKSCDSFIFLAPEFNHSISGALKNALDLLDWQLHHKPAAFIGYGLSANGARAVEHLKAICDSFSMMAVVPNILISILDDFTADAFQPRDWHNHMLPLLIKETLELYPYSKHYLESYAERRGNSMEPFDYNEEWTGHSPAGIRGFCEIKKRR